MKSPFPGMDPYLESHWRDVHTSLMVYARDQLQEQLPSDLLARVEEGVSIDDVESGSRTIYPDVRVVEGTHPAQGGTPRSGSIAVAEPLVIRVDDEPVAERHIEIVDASSGNRVVSAIEFLSPINKVPPEGRAAYRRKQREYLAAGVNLVEVDLIRDGELVLAVPLAKVPRERRNAYAVCVRRRSDPLHAALYTTTLRERLSPVPVPLRFTDSDVVLKIQELVDLCYRSGRYGASIDYKQEPSPRLDPQEAQWADALLRERGLR